MMLKAALGLLTVAGLAAVAAFSGATTTPGQAKSGCDCVTCCSDGGCCCETEVCLLRHLRMFLAVQSRDQANGCCVAK